MVVNAVYGRKNMKLKIISVTLEVENARQKNDVFSKIENGILRWYGHFERMDEGISMKQIYKSVNGRAGRDWCRRMYHVQIEDI